MSILSKYGAYIAIGTCLLLAAGAYGLQQENWRLVRELDAANAQIRQLQQAQALSEAASQKLTEHKEATREAQARQQAIVNDALQSNQSWADTFLPDDIIRMFKAATGSGDVPPTSGAPR